MAAPLQLFGSLDFFTQALLLSKKLLELAHRVDLVVTTWLSHARGGASDPPSLKLGRAVARRGRPLHIRRNVIGSTDCKTGSVGKHPDLDRINDLTARLEDLCREAEYIRDRIRNVSGQPSIWPDRFRALQADTDHAVASELTSSGRGDG